MGNCGGNNKTTGIPSMTDFNKTTGTPSMKYFNNMTVISSMTE